jgi:hypothetical protein
MYTTPRKFRFRFGLASPRDRQFPVYVPYIFRTCLVYVPYLYRYETCREQGCNEYGKILEYVPGEPGTNPRQLNFGGGDL